MSKQPRKPVPVRKLRLGEPDGSKEYWLAQTPQARLAALEEIRREYHLWKYGGEPEFQMVVRVVKRPARG